MNHLRINTFARLMHEDTCCRNSIYFRMLIAGSVRLINTQRHLTNKNTFSLNVKKSYIIIVKITKKVELFLLLIKEAKGSHFFTEMKGLFVLQVVLNIFSICGLIKFCIFFFFCHSFFLSFRFFCNLYQPIILKNKAYL